MREFVVRTCLTVDFLLALPVFLLLIWRDPERYALTLRASEASIRERILQYRKGA
jgi:hypothetical protein